MSTNQQREWLERRLENGGAGHDLRRKVNRLLGEIDRGECPNPAQAVGVLYDEFRRAVAEAEE